MGTPNSKMDQTWLRSVLRLRVLMRKRVHGWRSAFKWRQWRDYCNLAIIWLRTPGKKPVRSEKPWQMPKRL